MHADKLVMILTCVFGFLNDIGVQSFVVDGFPRDWEQTEVVESEVSVVWSFRVTADAFRLETPKESSF